MFIREPVRGKFIYTNHMNQVVVYTSSFHLVMLDWLYTGILYEFIHLDNWTEYRTNSKISRILIFI